jgi:hypothetical protein
MNPQSPYKAHLNFQYSPYGPNLYLYFSVGGTRKAEQKDDAGVDKQYSSKTLFTDEKQKVASY